MLQGYCIYCYKKSVSLFFNRFFFSILLVPARFEETFAVVNAKKGDSARMKCEALGDQPLAVTWRRDENVISKSGDDRFENLLSSC